MNRGSDGSDDVFIAPSRQGGGLRGLGLGVGERVKRDRTTNPEALDVGNDERNYFLKLFLKNICK